MKIVLKKIRLIISGFCIVFMLGNCGGGVESEGESKKPEKIIETTNTKSTTSTSIDKEKDTKPLIKSYNLEKGYYYDFFAHVQVPVIINYTDIYEKFGDRTKDDKGEKEATIQLVISIKNVTLEGNTFSGIYKFGSYNYNYFKLQINNDNWDNWEGSKDHGINVQIDSCYGEFSKDSKTIKYVELEGLWFSHYGAMDSAYGIEKRRNFVRLENIPVVNGWQQDIVYKKFQYKHEPTIMVHGGYRFLSDAKNIISSITEADYINYSARQHLNKNRQGKITWDVWEEIDENLQKVDLEKISKLNPSWTIAFRQGEKIFDIEKEEEEVNKANEELIGEDKVGKIHIEKTTFLPNETMLIGAEYKFRNNLVFGDEINEIYIGFLPKDTPLDFLFENAFESKKYVVTKNELKQYKNDPLFTSKTFFQFKAPEPSTNVATGIQNEIEHYDVILFFINPSKKIVEIDRKSIITTSKKSNGFIRLFGDNQTFKPGEDIKLIYHENNTYKVEVTDMWVGLLRQNIVPELTPSKSDFIATKDIRKNDNEILHFKAPHEPGKYKFLLYKEVIPSPLGVLNFEVIGE